MEGIVNSGPTVASFLMTSGSRRWYVVGEYVPTHDASADHRIKQMLEVAPKGIEIILLGDLNIRLRKLRDDRENELSSALAGRGLGDMTSHFTPRLWYQGTGCWNWKIRWDVRLVTGRCYYILISDMNKIFKAGVWKERIFTDHRMVLVVLQREGALQDHRYIVGRIRWPLASPLVRPQIEGEEAFTSLKGGVERKQKPKVMKTHGSPTRSGIVEICPVTVVGPSSR